MPITDLPTNASTLSGVMAWANTQSGNILGNILVIGIFVALFVGMKGFDTSRAIFASSFITAIISLLFYYGGFVSRTLVIIFVVLTFLAGFFMTSQNTGV